MSLTTWMSILPGIALRAVEENWDPVGRETDGAAAMKRREADAVARLRITRWKDLIHVARSDLSRLAPKPRPCECFLSPRSLFR